MYKPTALIIPLYIWFYFKKKKKYIRETINILIKQFCKNNWRLYNVRGAVGTFTDFSISN